MSSTKPTPGEIIAVVLTWILAVAFTIALVIATFTLIVWIPFAVFVPALGFTFWQLVPIGIVLCLVAAWVAGLFRGASKRIAAAAEKKSSDTVLYMGGK